MLIFTRLAIFLSIVTCTLSCQVDKNNNSELVGVWNLHTIDRLNSSRGWVKSDWMRDGKGILHYDINKHMSVHFTPKDYNLFPDSLKSYWYVGSYIYDKDSNFVEHLRLMHSSPDENGKTVRRELKFKSDTLLMYSNEYGMRLKWLKL